MKARKITVQATALKAYTSSDQVILGLLVVVMILGLLLTGRSWGG